MTTSKPARLVLFHKQNCEPCKIATKALALVLQQYPHYGRHVELIQKEDVPSLVAVFELKLYPTVLIMDKDSREISRKVGSSSLTYRWWHQALTAIATQNQAAND